MIYRIMVGGKFPVTAKVREALENPLVGVAVLGFVTTRTITAQSESEACEMAIRAVELELSDTISFHSADETMAPTFHIQEVSRLSEADANTGPRRGFTFYPESKIS